RLAAIGVTQIRCDDAVLVLEFLQRVKGVGREARDRGVQPAAGNDQQREAGADLFVVDTDVALLVQWHSSVSLPGVVFRVRSRLAKPREPLGSSSRHAAWGDGVTLRSPPGLTTRVRPGRRSGRLWASLPSAEYGTTARPTRGAAGRFPGETGPCPPRPGLFRLGPSPTACAGSPHTSGWRN